MPKRVTAFLELVAVLSFALTLFLLWSDKTSSAGVAVALSFGALLFRMLPDLESFEILGLKAKLRERLQEAERILGMMRDLASVMAKASVLNTSWSNRMGGLSYAQQSELLDQQARQLKILGLDDMAIRDVKRPALAMFSCDVARHLHGAVNNAARVYADQYRRIQSGLGQPLKETELEAKRVRSLEWVRGRIASYDPKVADEFMKELHSRAQPLGDHLNVLIDRYRWSAADRDALRAFAAKLSVIDAYNWSAWRLGPEVGQFLKERPYSLQDKAQEAFPNGITGPDWDIGEELPRE